VTGEVRLLTFTSLYPSAARPRHGIFVESRLQRLVARGGLRARVIAPVPWFPFTGARWGEYARMAATPLIERRSGIEVRYPRYLMLPRIGMALQPQAMAQAGLAEARRLLAEGAEFDLIDAHYLYPDGVAAAMLARALGRPFVVSARGSDVNVIGQMPGPRDRIVHALEHSAGVIAVSAALRSALIGMGVPGERITVLRNGVDTELFRPVDRSEARRELGLPIDARIIASVGNLVPGKRNDLALEAAAAIDGVNIVFVGRGSEHGRLERMAHELGLSSRVWFFDEMPQPRLRLVYSAAEVLVLASEREGWPNVLLESAACGTPAVAFNVGGVPEILTDPAAGTIVRGEQNAARLADAVRKLLQLGPSPAAARAAAIRFSWEPVLDAQLALYRRVAQFGAEPVAGAVREVARA
jgi:glycosyltransferase involved in cell wall biosynthesis